jgi:glucokinase
MAGMEALERVVAADLGGTKTAVAVVGSDGTFLSKLKYPAEKASPQASVEQLVELAGEALAAASLDWEQIGAAGVAVPGIYFPETGRAWAPNLWGRDQIPLREWLAGRLPVAAVIDSDRSAYVLGEQWLGVAQGLEDVVFLVVGTGIGAGIITGGRLCRGAGGVAGAAGWFALDPRYQEIYGQMGCFEAEASGPAVARRAAAAGLWGLSPEAVATRARLGDRTARAVLEETASWLAMGVANIVSLLNPQMVVLGGGLMQIGDMLLATIRSQVLRWAQPQAARQARIELSRLGEDAGLLGAARLALLRGKGD